MILTKWSPTSLLRQAYLFILHHSRGIPFSLGERMEAWSGPDESLEEQEAISSRNIRLSMGLGHEILLPLWPSGKLAAFNLNFDDLSTVYDSAAGVDFGGRETEGITPAFESLLTSYPELKVTQFVIPCPDPRFCGMKLGIHPGTALSQAANSSWLAWLKRWSGSSIFEIAMHGYSHYNPRAPLRKHAEFAFTTPQETEEVLDKSVTEFRAAGFSPEGFRPPGWDMAADFSLVDALAKRGFSYVAGSAPGSGLNYGEHRVSNLYPSTFRGIVNLPQNVELDLPIEEIHRRVSRIIDLGGMISLKGHYTNLTNITNALTPVNLQKIADVIAFLRQRHSDKIWFATMGEVAHRFTALRSLRAHFLAEPSRSIIIENTSQFDLHDLDVWLPEKESGSDPSQVGQSATIVAGGSISFTIS